MENRFKFHYDESEHSRKINLTTIQQENYYDNFITTIVGWREDKANEIESRYLSFEDKFDERKSKGELKSSTIKPKQLQYGFASLNRENVEFISDFLNLFDEKIFLYFSVTSKVEYLVIQLFRNYNNNIFSNTEAMKYSIVKSIVMYKPKEVLNCMYERTSELIFILKNFYKEKIEFNEANSGLKEKETKTFKEFLVLLDDISEDFIIDWEYGIAFDGFNRYLKELKIDNYSLILDMEGNGATINGATQMGLKNVMEIDSKKSIGVRWSDMVAGLISKFLKSFHQDLKYTSSSDGINKKLLNSKWFDMTEQQLSLYKKFYFIITHLNNAHYKSFSGIYADDLLTFITFLGFISNFGSVEEIKQDIELMPEYANIAVCERLEIYFDSMYSKLPITLVSKKSEQQEFFLGQRGQKIYFNEEKQPLLNILEVSQTHMVLSVGLTSKLTPTVTIQEDGEVSCYRLPNELSEWAVMCVNLANSGTNLFPTNVMFGIEENNYYAEIF